MVEEKASGGVDSASRPAASAVAAPNLRPSEEINRPSEDWEEEEEEVVV